MLPLDRVGDPTAPAQNPEVRREQLRQAARGFEGLFLAQLIKVMRSTAQSPRTSEMAGKSVMGDYADMELGRVLAERRGIGLADLLYRSLAERETTAGSPTPSALSESVSTPRPFVPLTRPGQTPARYYDLHVDRAARQYNLNPQLVRSVIEVESGGRADALSSQNAKGLMQLTDSTADMLGVKDIWDPKENIAAGVRYLRSLLDRFDGNLVDALAAYNAGPGAVERHGGPPPYPETRAYVRRVLDLFWRRSGGGPDGE